MSTLISYGILAAIIGALAWLALRQRSTISSQNIQIDLLEATNEQLRRNAKIDAKPMDADDADSNARERARRLQSKD